MKRLLFIAGVGLTLASCSNATDGSAATDTTTMPVDTVAQNNAGMDTGTTINTNTGAYSTTDTAGMRKPDVRSSTASDPKTRNSTPGSNQSNDSVQRQRQ
jgi:hypothetical protein